MAQMGGLGFIHYNLPVEEQVAQALRVKRHVPGFMVAPAVLSAHDTIADWEGLKVWTRSCLSKGHRLRCAALGHRKLPARASMQRLADSRLCEGLVKNGDVAQLLSCAMGCIAKARRRLQATKLFLTRGPSMGLG